MKNFILLLALMILGSTSALALNDLQKDERSKIDLAKDASFLMEHLDINSVEDFLALTPKTFRQKTGKRLGIKNTFKLKAAQKVIRKKMSKEGESDIPKGLYIVGSILGFAWILMGVMDDWGGKNWWVSLLLFALCWLPGVIHAFSKQKQYYS